jgi:hypothetical protein
MAIAANAQISLNTTKTPLFTSLAHLSSLQHYNSVEGMFLQLDNLVQVFINKLKFEKSKR